MNKEVIVCPVMIIDDDEDDRYLLRRLLKQARIQGELLEAEHGLIALEMLTDSVETKSLLTDQELPLTIFLDINMPIMNGFEFLERYSVLQKSDANFEAVIFAMISSSNLPEDIDRARSYGFVKKFIAKSAMTALDIRTIFEGRMEHTSHS